MTLKPARWRQLNSSNNVRLEKVKGTPPVRCKGVTDLVASCGITLLLLSNDLIIFRDFQRAKWVLGIVLRAPVEDEAVIAFIVSLRAYILRHRGYNM